MPLTTSSTTSASRHEAAAQPQITRGKTVERPPMRWIVRSPIRSSACAPGYEHATTVTR